MKTVKKVLNHIFVDGLSGMALGLFSTLIVGTILAQVGTLVGGDIGKYITLAATAAKAMMGAGIGVGVACKFKASPLVTTSAATVGMVGAFASKIIAGTFFANGVVSLAIPGEPLGAFVAAFVGIELGRLVSGKTKLDILVTPIVTICSGCTVGLLVGPGISKLMMQLGELVNMGAHEHPFLMGIIVSVLMGMILTLPISSAAIGVVLGLSGIAAGAATIGCSAQMVGFAIASYRENKMGGLLAQGVGTSMLQVPNIMRHPLIWIPPILTSAILGPISTCILKMTSNPTGSGMGTSGLIGQIMTYQTMTGEGTSSIIVIIEIVVMHVIAPALICLAISEFMRFKGFIKPGDMKLDV